MEASKLSRPPIATLSGAGASPLRPTPPGQFQEFLREAGELFAFAGRALWELHGVWRYFSEVLRQAGILITSSAVVMWAGIFIFSNECGLETEYIFRSFGASSYAGTVTSVCQMKMMTALLLAWFFAAKVGAGLAAELGSMRINDELAAMDALGLNTMRYVVSSRLAAVMLVIPAVWFLGLGVAYGGYVFFINSVHDLSLGQFATVHWEFQSPRDLLFATILAMSQVLIITIVALYYGYTARGGPIGVGRATAKAMSVNLIVPLLVQALLGAVFWGPNYHAPIGG
jgi:phospholipid/cholesterol/gamma-HCH transport system permease protein